MKGLGRALGLAGIALETGGTGKILGIVIGGATGVAVTSFIPIPGARVVGGIVGGMIGGAIGGFFDYPGAGEAY